MTSRVSTLLNVGREDHYVFLLLDWYQFADGVREELNRQAEAFGHALGETGTFVMPFRESSQWVGEQVIEKPWPDEIKQRFNAEMDPIILVFDRDWETFDPREHPYAIIWVKDFRQDPALVRPALQELVHRARRGEDVIEYLHGVAKREQLREDGRAVGRGAGMLARLASYVEIKPSVFGVEIDLKAILKDLGDAFG